MNLFYPQDSLAKVLESKAVFENAEDEEACLKLVNDLTVEDREVAARTSYAYWYASVTSSSSDSDDDKSSPSSTIQQNMAVKEARRHFVGKKGSYEQAQESLQASLESRKEWQIDLLRLCFVENAPFCNDQEKELCEEYKQLIEEELPRQHLIFRGRDLEGRPMAIYSMRQDAELNVQGFLLTRLLMAERGAAVAEYLFQGGPEEQFTVFFRTSGYERSNVPPMHAIREMSTILQGNYPERLHKFIVLDPPFWMRSLYNIISYFLDENTSQKTVMVAGEEERNSVLEHIVAEEQAMPFMRSDGVLSAEIDVDYYLHQVPFFCLYDDCDSDKIH